MMEKMAFWGAVCQGEGLQAGMAHEAHISTGQGSWTNLGLDGYCKRGISAGVESERIRCQWPRQVHELFLIYRHGGGLDGRLALTGEAGRYILQ